MYDSVIYELGDSASNSQGSKYNKSLSFYFDFVGAEQHNKIKECQRSIVIENTQRAPVLFYVTL